MPVMVTKSPVRLYATPNAVILRFLQLNEGRVGHIVKRTHLLPEEEVGVSYENILHEFKNRHRDIEKAFTDHFNKINEQSGQSLSGFSENKKLLLGALFTMEYSIKAAALFNPSIVVHPDQSDLLQGEQRFIMSLRATGEGHVSSIIFQTGIVTQAGDIVLDTESKLFTRLQKRIDVPYGKDFIRDRVANIPYFNTGILDAIPATFTVAEVQAKLKSKEEENPSINSSVELLEEVLDMNYELVSSSHLPMNEKVIFPNAKGESMGMEDIRFVKFEDEDESCYYGTYTAYNGKQIKTQLIETTDFDVFKIRTLYGAAVSDKGMALFPEKINGQYVMISRQGGETINIMFSDNIYNWENFRVLMEPRHIWEFVQLGNCGSPIKTNKGWLLLTHGVGPLRTYVISAVLLDLLDPTKIIGRMTEPFISANESEREGYVPNVVYTCGYMRHGDLLIIPYAVSDSATGFVTVDVNELLNEMNL